MREEAGASIATVKDFESVSILVMYSEMMDDCFRHVSSAFSCDSLYCLAEAQQS